MVIQHDSNGGHLDPIEVAEHADGLLTADHAAAVSAHLAHCAECQAVASSVTAVTAHLAAEPRELPIPDGVAARIDAALADEAATRAGAAAPVSRDRRPGFAERFLRPLRERMPAIAVAAASIAVLGLIGYTVANEGLAGGGDDATAESADSADDAGTADEQAPAPMDAPEELAEEEADEESADLDQGSATAEDGEDSAGSDDSAERYNVTAPQRDALTAELQDIVAGQAPLAQADTNGEACGTALAESLGQELIGSTDTDLVETGSILVAVDAGVQNTVDGWLLPDCGATQEQALLMFTARTPK